MMGPFFNVSVHVVLIYGIVLYVAIIKRFLHRVLVIVHLRNFLSSDYRISVSFELLK